MRMVVFSRILDDWRQVESFLPTGLDLDKTARSRGALTRVREIKDGASLLRLALAFGACGMSLRETCTWAEAAGVARLSNPSLIERLEKAAPWLGDIAAALIAEQAKIPSENLCGYCLRALDATALSVPGATSTSWRLHVGFDLTTSQIDQFSLTDAHGAEKLQRFDYQHGDIVLADRGYAKPYGLRPIIEAGAHFIVRSGWAALRLLNRDGTKFDLFAALEAQKQEEGEVTAYIDDGSVEPLALRLIIRRKTPEQAQAERSRFLRQASKRGKKPDPRSLEATKYVLLFTTLPAETFPASKVLALYRFRWQIEIAFKRMKSIAGLDKLAARKPGLAQAWIYARLIAFLIAEKNAGQVPDSFPSAICLPLFTMEADQNWTSPSKVEGFC